MDVADRTHYQRWLRALQGLKPAKLWRRLESASNDYPTQNFDIADVQIKGRVIRTEKDW